MIKYSFFTISPREYVGKSFDVMNIIDDIKKQLQNNAKIINHTFNAIREQNGSEVVTYNIIIDFSMKLSMEEIKQYAKANRGIIDRIKRRKPVEITYRAYKKTMYKLLSEIYGVSYNPKQKNRYFDITFEGSRVE